MFSFIKRLFSKKIEQTETDFTATVYEQWTADFSDSDNRRFTEEDGDGYSVRIDKTLSLSLLRKNIYAWTVNPQYQYKNLALDAVIDFSSCAQVIAETKISSQTTAGICAFGFLLRYTDESNYLSVLLSDKGFFRVDAVFNGNQIPLTGWTGNPVMPEKYKRRYSPHEVPVQIILNDTSIALIINCTPALFLEDDTVQTEGYTAFAGQNWNEAEIVEGKLAFFSIESREIQCDAAYRTWASEADFQSGYRMQLARSMSAVGRIIPALIEIKKAFEKDDLMLDDFIFASRLYASQNLFEEAESAAGKALSLFPGDKIPVEEKASLLYLQGKYDELSSFLKEQNAVVENSAILSSIKAHSLALIHEYEQALNFYTISSRLEPGQIMHLKNAASMLSQLGREEEAADTRLSLLHSCIDNKDLSGFSQIESEIDEKTLQQGQKMSLLAARGKRLYLEGNNTEAKKLLEKYASKKAAEKDSEALFALSLIYIEEGYPDKAETILMMLVKEETAKASYYRCLSECEHKLQKNAEALVYAEKALSLDPYDGWALYVKAEVLFENGAAEKAFEAVYACLSILSEELCVLDLYARLMKGKGRLIEVLNILDAVSSHSGKGTAYRTDALHLCANYYARECLFKEAEVRYKQALLLSPKDAALICDYASVCLKTDRVNEADSLVSSILGIRFPSSLYSILASIALKKGESSRAELALKQGLEDLSSSPFDYCTLLIDLCHFYLQTNKTSKAEETCKKLLSIEKSERTKELEKEIWEKTSRQITCGLCSITWRVPLELIIPDKMSLTAQPPENMPAGNCPVCAKVYCIGCVKHTLSDDGRFFCPECGVSLKIQDKGIYYLLNEWNKKQNKGENV